ncbi:MAG: peptidoglycan DD-metalloendopeptidase family protein [Methyloceanibacter sp.]
MDREAFGSRAGRGALAIIAAGFLLGVGGCSSGVSRFDYPAFHLTNSSTPEAPSATNASYVADPGTTAALPVPEESVYANGADPNGGSRVARNDLPPPPPPSPAYAPPPHAYTPRVTPASYSPAPRSYVAPRKIAYRAPTHPPAEPTVVRETTPQTSGHTVTVGKGDSLSLIAKRHGVTLEALKAANNLPDTRIEAGQVLHIPEPGAPVPSKAAVANADSASKTYKVEKGDTPHEIAAKLGVTEKDLIARNKLRPENLQIGQVLIVPDGASAPDNRAAPQPTPVADMPNVHVVKTTTIPAPGAPVHVEGAADAPSAPAPAPVAASPEIIGGGATQVTSVDRLPTPEPMSGGSFRWPVQGRIISAFGTKPDGGHNDGINVAVPQGTSVKAAENGVVAYAGNELKGYGNLVLIRHANNWVSAYAHNEEILVKRGDQVRRGQIIAKAGNTGSVSQPQLHFELRKGSRPVDPTKYMSQTQASAD